MSDLARFRGIVCPVLTPFDRAQRIDFGALDGLLDFLIDRGVHGVMAAGSTGEGQLLTLDERKALLESVVEKVAGRRVVIAHVGCMSTAETIDLARHAQAAGADAISAIVPFFYTFDDESILGHFAALSQAVPDTPFFLYSFPGNAKNDVSPELLVRLLRVAPNLIGLKVSSGDLQRVQAYLESGGDDLLVLLGADGLVLPGLSLGVHGQVSGNSNVFPEEFCRLYKAFSDGNLAEALAQQRRINRIRLALKDGVHPAYFKAALGLRGLPMGAVRAPMRELSEAELEQLRTDMLALADGA